MKQFQKVGVAAAVATVAAGTVAQADQQYLVQRLVTWQSSLTTQYWMALTLVCTSSIPPIQLRSLRYVYVAEPIPKTHSTFNLVMSPRDEWTANIGAGGANGVLVTTNDTTCTVPASLKAALQCPTTYLRGRN